MFGVCFWQNVRSFKVVLIGAALFRHQYGACIKGRMNKCNNVGTI
uniref:Uncharacterized protein n=1 Tax=Rhizophora mucronata TaxID=61149 RepID=A0A2P2P777_RHIMU